MRYHFAFLYVIIAFLLYQILQLNLNLDRVERNAAIAVISADIANNKIGAISPFFKNEKEIFFRNWIRGNSIPLAIFRDDVLSPLRKEIDEKSNDDVSISTYNMFMNQR